MKFFRFFILFLLATNKLLYADGEEGLMRDLLIVNYWDQRLSEKLPVTYNHWLQGGYFTMPSARMGDEGEIGFGYSYVPPYRTWNLRFQLINCLELSGNYRIFKGVDDPILGQFGFGDFSDKGANLKFSLFSPEASRYKLPGIAIGVDDVIGTKGFNSQYIVFTQVILNYNLEISLGYGKHRIRGLFGGMAWHPFRCYPSDYLRGLSFAVEYDATPYKDKEIERHPKGNVKKSPWNFGLKYRLWDTFDLSLAYIRGDAVAFSVSGYYNFGTTKGFLPKIDDALPYRAPLNLQEVGCLRPEDVMLQDYVYAFREQGFEILKVWITECFGRKSLRFEVINATYRQERFVRERLNALLASITPIDIDRVIVVISNWEAPIQEYHYEMDYVNEFREKLIGKYELNVLTPLCEVTCPNPFQSKLIYQKEKELWNLEVLPKTNFLFGSAKGKFKYAAGLSLNVNGFLPDDTGYYLSFGYYIFSNLYDINDMDRLNPSQLINVRTDSINYLKQKSVTVDQAYLQRTWNMGCGWYSRISVGLFESAYGGSAGELLYYPVHSDWAIGAEAAIVKKRTYDGWGFTSRIRKLDGFKPTYRTFIGSQYFLNLYYDWRCTGLNFKISIGQFLAKDFGARYQVSRYFQSGVRLGFWYTHTSAYDVINGQRYFDKGIFFSMPLDLFYTKSSRSRWGYGMAAWLRDVGAVCFTGGDLYNTINDQRQ